MKKRIIILLLLCLNYYCECAVIPPLRADPLTKNLRWTAFKQQLKLKYRDHVEEQSRQGIFERKIQAIHTHNAKFEAGNATFRQAPSWTTVLTANEYKRLRGFRGVRKGAHISASSPSFLQNWHHHHHHHNNNNNNNNSNNNNSSGSSYPAFLDYRELGLVTGVKNQGDCGDCWAFSTTGALEGQFALVQRRLTSLSEQNLVDCVSTNYGCDGGWMDYAFAYVQQTGGIDTEASYPYQGVQGTCGYNAAKSVGLSDLGYVDIASGDENALLNAVYTVGPVSAAIDASLDSFASYSSGVYNDPACSSTNLDHAVLVVGWGSDPNGGPYWLVKNSWGTDWGEQGYVRMARGRNQCGIATAASYPKVPGAVNTNATGGSGGNNNNRGKSSMRTYEWSFQTNDRQFSYMFEGPSSI